MRINENIAALQSFRNQPRGNEAAERGTNESTATRTPRGSDSAASVDGTTLERVAAENAAASISKIRDASLAAQLAALTADQIARSGQASLGVHAHLDPNSVAALLQS